MACALTGLPIPNCVDAQGGCLAISDFCDIANILQKVLFHVPICPLVYPVLVRALALALPRPSPPFLVAQHETHPVPRDESVRANENHSP